MVWQVSGDMGRRETRHKAQNCLTHICLISDAEPQGSQQGKEKLCRRGRERDQVPNDGRGDGQVEKKHKRGGSGGEEALGRRKER